MEVVELTGTLNVMQTGDLESGENRTMMTARLLSPPHHAPVTSLLISSNKLMSASWDKTIKVWDLSKSELPFVKDLATHSDYVTCLAASDNVIVSGSRDCQILVWSADLSASKQLHIASPNPSFAMANWVLSLAIANNHIYAGFKDETVQVWNEQSLAYLGSLGGYKETLAPDDSVDAKAVSAMFRRSFRCLAAADNFLYAGSRNIHVWDMSDFEKLTREDREQNISQKQFLEVDLLKGGSDLHALVIHKKKLFSCLAQTTVCVWDIADPKNGIQKVAELSGHADYIASLCITDQFIIAGSYDRVIKVWKISKLDQALQHRVKGDGVKNVPAEVEDDFPCKVIAHSNCISALAVSNNMLFSGSWDASIICQLLPVGKEE